MLLLVRYWLIALIMESGAIKMLLSDLYTYALYKINKQNGDIIYIEDFESIEEVAEELEITTRQAQRLTLKTIEEKSIEELKNADYNYVIIKETSEELAEKITNEGWHRCVII